MHEGNAGVQGVEQLVVQRASTHSILLLTMHTLMTGD